MIADELKNLTYLSDTFIGERKVYEEVEGTGNPAILRVIEGPLAEYDNLNRNKRMYSESLWDNVLASSYLKEQLGYGTLYGECNHPTERYEVDFERVSHSIVNLWKVPEKNQIYGKIFILNTPFGRILNTLYEAGGIIGYSSRAGGVLHQRKDYIEVDEKTYNFVTFDAVPYPSVVVARPGVVTEGVESLVTLPDEVHEKLCSIITESGASAILKDFIYSIEGYDMTRERQLFESNKPIKTDKEQEIKETTLSLLKESSSQIDSLKADAMSLKSKNQALQDENNSLLVKLNESLERITKLSAESKDLEERIARLNESRPEMENDTIIHLRNKVDELTSVIEDKDLELEELQGVHEAFKALQLENAGMKSSISMEQEVTESFQTHSQEVENELKEAYSELSAMIKESDEKDSKIMSLTESVEVLKQKLATEANKVKKLTSQVREIKSEKVALVKESKNQDESNSLIIENLREENRRLKDENHKLNESVSAPVKSYRKDLVEVVSGIYGLSTSKVLSHLNEGFTKEDIYRVCEGMTNSVINGVSYDNIVESTITPKIDNESTSPTPEPKVANLYAGMGNRRGVGLLK